MLSKKVSQALVAIVRMAVLVFAFLCLLYVVKDRYDSFMKNGIVMRRYIHKFREPWFEVAICFGPKIPGDLVDQYMNRTKVRFPFRYRTFTVKNKKTKKTKTLFEGAMAVDSVAAYRRFFMKGGFNWTDGILGISSLTPSLLSQHLDGIRHRITLGGKHLPDTTLTHTDIPFLLEYAICRNYSYNVTFPRGYSGALEHQIYVSSSVHKALFDIAWYIDLYVYPRQNFTEFPLIADHIPFRVDLRSHQLLEVTGSKTEKMVDESHSLTSETHTHVNCLTWCLARGLLDKVKCIMPLQIPYIYNTTGRIPETDVNLANQNESDAQWLKLYPPTVAWPWMTKYTDLRLCRSAEELNATFSKFSQVYFPRGSSRYPLLPHCAKHCPPRCDEYTVVIHPAGTQLVPSKNDIDDGDEHFVEHETVHSVTFQHSTTMTVSKEHWIYGAWEFFVDVSGMSSFVMGLSVIAIHDWSFLLVQWAMQVIGLEDQDDIEEEEDEEEDAESKEAGQYHAEGVPLELAEDVRQQTPDSATKSDTELIVDT